MTRIAMTNGLVYKDDKTTKQRLIVRFTSDEIGETLSISNDKDVMLLIPYEGVDKLIEEARALGGKESE